MLLKLLNFFLACSLLAFSFLAYSTEAAWQEPKNGPPWCPTPPNASATNPGCYLPLNVSNSIQIKGDVDGTTAGLGVNGILSAWRIFATDKLGVGPDPDPLTEGWDVDATAVLDVNGQIRIRGGSPGQNKILTSVLDPVTGLYTGLASWL